MGCNLGMIYETRRSPETPRRASRDTRPAETRASDVPLPPLVTTDAARTTCGREKGRGEGVVSVRDAAREITRRGPRAGPNTFRARAPRKTTVGPRRDARGGRRRRSRVRTIVRLGNDTRVLGDRERATGFLRVRARTERARTRLSSHHHAAFQTRPNERHFTGRITCLRMTLFKTAYAYA